MKMVSHIPKANILADDPLSRISRKCGIFYRTGVCQFMIFDKVTLPSTAHEQIILVTIVSYKVAMQCNH